MARSPFAVNFRELPLSSNARNQLGAIAESLVRHPNQKSQLVNEFILPHHYDPQKGLYIPLTASTKLLGYITENFSRIPPAIVPAEGSWITHFGNALLLPAGWGRDFNPANADPPSLRSTNIGFLVVTHEFDCKTLDDFEEQLAWFRTTGDFKKVDSELRTYRDYLGYCIVFSGNRSLHIHLLFDTTHLEHAPYNADWESRLANQAVINAIMHNVHAVYWMAAGEIITRVLTPSLPTDPSLKSITQWRRLPFGIRTLEKDSLLALAAGSAVPQLVVKEHIRGRAAQGSNKWLVAPNFSTANPIAQSRTKKSGGFNLASTSEAHIIELQLMCQQEWGSYPRPVSMGQERGEWCIRFENHEHDRNPSTIVVGNNRKLLVRGENSFDRDFYLPEQMTANELGDYLVARFSGRLVAISNCSGPQVPQRRRSPLERPSEPRLPFFEQLGRDIAARFPEPISTTLLSELVVIYREKLRQVIHTARTGIDSVIQSGEGIGKTTAHFHFLANEAMDEALSQYGDGVQRFSCFAFRSHDQAAEKSRECLEVLGDKYQKTVHISSFWQHYKNACRDAEEEVIPRSQFRDHSVNAVLKRIREEQPAVFFRLEKIRKNLWKGGFDAGSTMLFTTHATARLWHFSRITRIWHHPDFRPLDEHQDHEQLRKEFVLANVVFDEPELDELLHVIPQHHYEHLRSQQQEFPNWRALSHHEREAIFKRIQDQSITDIGFEDYDELMRLDLAKMDEVEVDFAAIPFGNDNSSTGIYRAENGKKYYLSPRSWMFASKTHWAFLTTERLVTLAIVEIYRKQKRGLLPICIDHLNGIYPRKTPVYFDRRASKRNVSALAREIVKSNPNAVVISDGVDGSVERVLSFQKMKGHNGLSHNDIYVIVTPLAPEQYAHLNVLGQWLNIPDIIGLYYQGLINQAVGRNSGFRQQDNTTTVVVVSLKMRKLVPDTVNRLEPRIILYQVNEKPW